MLGFRRIDRYVIREVLGPILLGFTLFTFVLLSNAFFLVAQQTISKNLGWDLTFRMFALELPRILILTVPMAVLLGSLIAVGRLSADHEWVALQGAGRGPSVLLRPLATVGFLAAILCMVLYLEVAPRTNFAQRQMRGEIVLASNTASDLTPRTFYSQLDDVVLFIEDIRPGQVDGRLDGVFVHYTDRSERREELILARQGRIRPRSDGSGDLRIDLWDAAAYRIDADDPNDYTIQRFEHQSRTQPAPAFVRAFQQPPNPGIYDMTTTELLEEIRVAPSEKDETIRGIRTRSAVLEFHMRLALPTACLLFAMLAVPLGVRQARSGKGAGFAVSIGVFLVYYVVFMSTRNLAYDGRIPAALGAWSANLLMIPWFVYGTLGLRRPGGGDGPLSPVLRLLASLGRGVRRLAPTRVEIEEIEEEKELHPEVIPHRHGGTSSRLISRLDAYIAAQYVRVLALALTACYLLYVIVELRGLLDDVLKSGTPALTMVQYFGYYAPGMLPYTLPVACMTGGIVAITVLARNGELTAIKAGGVSVRRAAAPLIVVTTLLCAGYFLVQDRITPTSNQKRQELRDRITGRSPRTYGLPPGGGWVFGSDGSRLYHYKLFDDDTLEFRGLSILTLDREAYRFRSHRFASTARWNGSAWDLTDGWSRTLPIGSNDPSTFETWERLTPDDLDPPTHFAASAEVLDRASKIADQMSVEQLSDRIAGLRQSGYDTTRLEVAYHAKFSQSLSPLVMLLLGLPFAFRVGRRGSLYGIGVAILLIMVYWATMATFQALGLETILPPILAAWAPNVLYGLLGAYLMLYART